METWKIAIKFHFILRARARFMARSICLPSFQCTGARRGGRDIKILRNRSPRFSRATNWKFIYVSVQSIIETTMGDQNSTAFYFYPPPSFLPPPPLLLCPAFSLTTRVIIVLCNYRISREMKQTSHRNKRRIKFTLVGR